MFKWLKRKFENAVQAEVEKREAERKENASKMWEEWKNEHPISISFGKLNDIKCMYPKAQEDFDNANYEEALQKLNWIIDEYIKLEEIVGLYVFILLVDTQKAIAGKDGALGAYDRGIEYYSNVSGEHTERWKDQLQHMRENYIEDEERLEQMRASYNFSIEDAEIIKALIRLEGIKVNEYRVKDYEHQNSFDLVWESVLNEVEKYEAGENSPLNKTTLKGAKSWLRNFSYLCSGIISEEYLNK